MTKIKFCGLTRDCDIDAANELKPEYIGFVFAKNSRRYIFPDRAKLLKKRLSEDICAVGVFVNEKAEIVADLINNGVINMIQLHGNEDERYIEYIRRLCHVPIIKAFRVYSKEDILLAQKSSADYILLDSVHPGSGKSFDWNLISAMTKKYFLAGGLDCKNVEAVLKRFSPYALDVSSGIETNGLKDKEKMRNFVRLIRKDITND